MSDIKVKSLIVAYYLSRCDSSDEKSYKSLGFSSFTEAFDKIGAILDENPNNLKNMRDEFDPLFPNSRKGWFQRPPSPSRRKIVDFFKDKSDQEVKNIVLDIINQSFNPIISEIESLIAGVNDDNEEEELIKDLGILVKETREKISTEFNAVDVSLSSDFKQSFGAIVREGKLGEQGDIRFLNATAVFSNRTNQKVYIPNQWFVLALYAVPLFIEISKYRSITEALLDEHKELYRNENGLAMEKKDIYAGLKNSSESSDIRNVFLQSARSFLEKGVKGNEEAERYAGLLLKFVTDYPWWLGGKGIERSNDYYVSPVLGVLNVVNASNEKKKKITKAYASVPELSSVLNNIVEHNEPSYEITEENTFDYSIIKDKTRKTGGINLIVYGAPGVGKSKYLEDNFCKPGLFRRVVFHPEYSYFDFVGSYKPVPIYSYEEDADLKTADQRAFKRGIPYIDYQYVEGPFIQVLCESLMDPERMHTLLIEELNRANAASVFGEVFQLLDRLEDGSSEFPVEPSKELRAHLISKGLAPFIKNGIVLPSNMNIVATMNSADQGVSVIDAAFKRRWNFKYLRINIDKAIHRDEIISYNNQSYTWGTFITSINNRLKQLGINEDRLIGPYFIKPDQVKSSAAIDKLLLYLWDDVLRHQRSQGAFLSSITCFSDLVDNFTQKDVLNISKFLEPPTAADVSPKDEETGEGTND